MADSEDSTTLPAISWRAILRGTGALPSGKTTGGAPSDPALQLWRNWQANHTEVVALTRQWQRIEKKLIHSVGIPEVAIRLSGEEEPKIAQSVDEIEDLVANEPAIEREALIAAFDERQKRWNEAAATLGFDAVDAELRTALGKERDFVASVPKTKASSLPGVAPHFSETALRLSWAAPSCRRLQLMPRMTISPPRFRSQASKARAPGFRERRPGDQRRRPSPNRRSVRSS